MPCVVSVPVVTSVSDGGCGLDVMTFVTLSSVMLGLRVICTASLADRLAVSVNPLVSSVSLTSESKSSCGQCLMKCWEKRNAVVNVSLLSTVSMQEDW